MKRSLKKILSLTLVIAVLVTSMVISSVGAVPAPQNPMQTVLMEAVKLDYVDKGNFLAALDVAAGDPSKNIAGDISAAAATIRGIFNNTITLEDTTAALTKYVALSSSQRSSIKLGISGFTLTSKNYSGNGFDTIVTKINTLLTGSSINNGYHDGVGLVIQGIEQLNTMSQNGAWVTDLSSNTAKIDFTYNAADPVVILASSQVSVLISNMETLNSKIASYPGSSAFDKLLNYAEDKINNDPSISNTEIAKMKEYINNINDAYYRPYVAPVVTPTATPTPTPAPLPDTASKVLETIQNADPNQSGAEKKALLNQLKSILQEEVAKAGTVAVTPTVVGTKATVTADQIKTEDILAKADAAIAKAEEMAKAVGTAKVDLEKKVVIDVGTTAAASVNVGLSSELLAKVQEKGIEKVEIATGDIKLNVAPDFIKEAKDSKSVSFEINKVTVTDELKAKMSEDQKALLANSNATVLDFNASVVSAAGTETKVTKFDKPITIKVKYTLKAGENKDKITVLYLADDGSVQNMVGRYDENTGEVVFNTKHFSTYVVTTVNKTFADIASSAWYKTQAEALAAKGIVAGRPGNNFAPNANITRAEFVTMLVKATGTYDAAATASFSDVSKDAWYYGYVASAVKAGIAGGIGNGKFAPNSLITREQMAVMIANVLGETVDNASSYLKASDADKISSYAKNAMALSAKNEFLVGNDNKLDPQGKATRAMAAVVVYKYFNYAN